MNTMKKNLMLTCAAIGFASFSLLASAHDHADCKDQANKEQCVAQFKAMKEAKLHDELKITAKQEPAWKAFIATFDHPGAMHKEQEKLSRAEAEKVPAPERLEKKITRTEKMHEAQKNRLAALKTLYAELTPEQQTLLNKRMAQLESKHHRRHAHRQHQAVAK